MTSEPGRHSVTPISIPHASPVRSVLGKAGIWSKFVSTPASIPGKAIGFGTESLRIVERLTTAEPDRADFQVDLVASLERMASVAPESAPTYLQRCLAILRALASENRLTPVQAKGIARFEGKLAELTS